MSAPLKFERSVLSHDEFETVSPSHHPAIYALDGKALQSLRERLRDLRGKERTLTRQKKREVRGKADARGKSFPGTAEHPLQRKQVFAAALKRVNKELARQQKIDARLTQVEAARRALELRRANSFVHHPESDPTADKGMQSVPSTRRRTRVPPSKVGSVSQQTKNNQAKRDARG